MPAFLLTFSKHPRERAANLAHHVRSEHRTSVLRVRAACHLSHKMATSVAGQDWDISGFDVGGVPFGSGG
ncbi:hypothetical protein BC937DRAFT_94110 [Endogone sp. FLAS-F59071]|nr:hypothetical protein BC937DRAFT_94110 [Endogone sp. FLAS-F59071]|eukprot:RUS22989.1 hypothetical protein BC937DRAFT_94110 [Endogone sp. FLAS-F59071]